MNENLTQYLTDVFRNEVPKQNILRTRDQQSQANHLSDRKITQFLLDSKYTVRLDEII